MTDTRIAVENQKAGTPKEIWDAATSDQIEGFATQISVDNGETVEFKINVNAPAGDDVPYRIEIYRLGYYGGDGATLVTTINTVGQAQVAPERDDRGVVDAGNWAVSASWETPEDAVSGVYLAKLQRLDADGNPIDGATNQIPFIVREDDLRADGTKSDIVLQTSDTTWHAYNGWSGNNGQVGGNFYGGFDQPDGLTNDPGPFAYDRAFAVSYNRPIITRDGTSPASGAQDYLFGADYAAIFWLEKNGYDVSYISGVDTDRLGADNLIGHKAYISVGHDEYWSGDQRDNVEAARDAGVNLLFWSGNEMYWRTRWDTSIVDGVEYRTLVCYKETWANFSLDAGPAEYANIDPSSEWTGTWRDLRFAGAVDANGQPTAVGAEPENSLTGQLFGPDGTGQFGGALDIPGNFATLRYWRDSGVPQTGALDLAEGILGYEWNTSPEDEYRPAGLIKLSETTIPWNDIVTDQGNRESPGIATHNLSLYRDAESGALVFGAGTVFWSWALSDQHDSKPYGANIENDAIQQLTVNVFAEMGIQPTTLQASLSIATASTDTTPATIAMANLADSVAARSPVIISGTAADTNGTADPADDGQVAVVEISFDGGATWKVAQGTTNWTYTWRPTIEGTYTVQARAIDDSLNVVAVPVAQDSVSVTAPVLPATFSLFDLGTPTGAESFDDGQAIQVGMKFAVDRAGSITELRYWRAADDAGDVDIREGYLWRVADGELLGSVTFNSGVNASGWQFASLATPIAITAGDEYVVSYRSLNNYVGTNDFFSPNREVAFDGVDNDAFSDPFGVINAPENSVTGEAGFNGNGVYRYGGPGVMPNDTFRSSNYWVDVTFAAATEAGNASPTITSGDFTVAENQTAVGSITATDANGDAIRYGIAGGADAARFTINAITGALAFVTAPDFEAPNDAGGNGVYDVIVSASDLIDAPVTQAITVTVTDLLETGPTGSTLFGPSETPAAFPTDDPYELGVKFTASVDGQITALRYYRGAVDTDDTDIRTLNLWTANGNLLGSVTVTSGLGESGWQVGTLTVPIAIEADTLYVASYGTRENYAFTANYFDTSKTSADGLLTAPAGSLVGGNGVFASGQPGAFPTASFNNSNYWVDVFFSETVANAAPTALNLSATTVAENNVPGATVATLSAVDANAGDTFTYALIAGEGSANNAAFSIVGNQLVLNASADFEAQSFYRIRLQVTDADGATFARTATISVGNVQEGFTGGVSIAGYTADGTANFTAGNTITDPDGIVGSIAYRWELVSNGAVLDVGPSFTADGVTTTELFRLAGTFTDALGATNTVTSAEAAIAGRGAKADTLNAGTGPTLLVGLGGRDTLNGGNRNDTLDGGGGNDLLIGGAGIDRLLGGDGKDQLAGGEGTDLLVGGFGADRLTGGAGADIFRFDLPTEGRDRILDFVHGEDRIAIDAVGFGGLSAIAFTAGRAASGPGAQFVYNAASGVLAFDADGQGGDAAVRFAIVTSAQPLTASDLFLV